MPPDLVKLMVAEVSLAVPAGPGVEAGMVTLTEVEAPRRRLRIVIAKPEARAIQAAWTGAIPTRPSTWDLYVSTVALLEARVDRVIITAVEEDRHFYASLEMEKGGERRVLGCRPSDAIAIALRAYGAEIFCLPAVVDAAGLNADGTKFGPWTWPEPEVSADGEDVPAAGSPAGGTAGFPPAGAIPGLPAVEAVGPAPADAPAAPAAADAPPAAPAAASADAPADARAVAKKAARPAKKAATGSAKKTAAGSAKKATPAKKKAAPAKKAAAAKKAPGARKAPPPDAGPADPAT